MRGRVGTPVSFQLGVNASFRLEARLLQPEGSRGEVSEVATMEVVNWSEMAKGAPHYER